jgi:hypothetical protein
MHRRVRRNRIRHEARRDRFDGVGWAQGSRPDTGHSGEDFSLDAVAPALLAKIFASMFALGNVSTQFAVGIFGRRDMNNRRKRDTGTAAVLTAIILPVLIVGLGLVVDGGQAYEVKRRVQKAADAGAIAAGQQLRRGDTAGFKAAALNDAALNGFDASNATISVFNPPLHGLRAGDSNFVEVRVKSDSPLYFASAFRQNDVKVEAFAVSGIMASDACIFAMHSTSSKAFWATGNAAIDLGDCGVHVNSESSTAARTDGGATVKASTINVVGNYSGNGFTPTPVTDAPPELDPWADLVAPTVGSCASTNLKITKNTTLSPGTYCGGIDISSQAKVTLNPGTYVLNGGGLKVAGGSKLSGNGVTFYLTESGKFKYGGIDFVGTTQLDLKAPTTGPLAGILFFQDRTIKTKVASKFAGTSDSKMTGGLYFSTTDLDFTGTHSTSLFKVIAVALTFTFHGTVDIIAPDSSSGLLTPNIMRAALVQ